MRRALALLIVLAGCEASGTLVVQVRTDLVPGRELAAVTLLTTAPDGETSSARVGAADARDWGAGVRIAELTGLAPGEYHLDVAAERSTGEVIVGRPARVEISGGLTVVTVLLTRDCQGVVCPDAGDSASAIACLGGRCVEESCTEETPEGCAPPACTSDGDCPPPAGDCAMAVCTESGACFDVPDHAMCAADEVCSVSSGCQPATPPAGCAPTSLSASGFHTCAHCADRTVRCWGNDRSGQLGDRATTQSDVAVVATELGAVDQVSTGGGAIFDGFYPLGHTCVLVAGEVSCLGSLEFGQIGMVSRMPGGTTSVNSLVPVGRVPTTIAQVSAGDEHTCARTSDGDVWCWGRNDHGATGQAFAPATGVAMVPSSGRVRAIAAGAWHTCVAHQAGEVTCWGRNTEGQLGAAPYDDTAAGQLVPLTGVTDLCAGEFQTCGIVVDGTLHCWGHGDQVGASVPAMPGQGPVQVVLGASPVASAVACGNEHTCATDLLGNVWCWGQSADGRLGSAASDVQQVPVMVGGLPSAAVDLAAGIAHTCALLDDASVWCWGSDSRGALGDGVVDSTGETPVRVSGLE